MKTCRTCHHSKSCSDFYTDTSARDGLRGSCKECARQKQDRYRTENPDAVRSSQLAYRSSERGKEVRREMEIKRLKSEKFRASVKAYAETWTQTEAGKESRKRRLAKFDKTEKGRAAAKRRNAVRRARGRLIVSTLTAAEWTSIVIQHGHACAYCRAEFSADRPVTLDHVTPISKGGHHIAANVVPACRPCNSAKKDRQWPTS